MSEETRVLLVDDSPNFIDNLVKVLRLMAKEIEFVTATNSREAMKILVAAHQAGQDFKFVFSDLDMERTDEGFEFGAELHRLEWAKGILFFVMTGRNLQESEDLARPGIQKIIKKGISTPQQILEEITRQPKVE